MKYQVYANLGKPIFGFLTIKSLYQLLILLIQVLETFLSSTT